MSNIEENAFTYRNLRDALNKLSEEELDFPVLACDGFEPDVSVKVHGFPIYGLESRASLTNYAIYKKELPESLKQSEEGLSEEELRELKESQKLDAQPILLFSGMEGEEL